MRRVTTKEAPHPDRTAPRLGLRREAELEEEVTEATWSAEMSESKVASESTATESSPAQPRNVVTGWVLAATSLHLV